MPLRKPSLLELFDPRDILQNFGTFNLTSIVGMTAGFQPVVNLIWKLARRIGINPLIISALIFGGFGKAKFDINFLIYFYRSRGHLHHIFFN